MRKSATLREWVFEFRKRLHELTPDAMMVSYTIDIDLDDPDGVRVHFTWPGGGCLVVDRLLEHAPLDAARVCLNRLGRADCWVDRIPAQWLSGELGRPAGG